LRALRKIIRKAFMNSPLTDTFSFKIDFESKLRDAYVDYIREHHADTPITLDSPSTLANEGLTSLFYIQTILQRENNHVPRDIIKESHHILYNLYCFLMESYSDNTSAIKTLDKLRELLDLYINTLDTQSLNILIESILKLLRLFIN